jgi:hypothetical protein
MRDALLELRWAAEASKPAVSISAPETKNRRGLIAILAITLAFISAAALYIGTRQTSPPPTDVRFEIAVPEMTGAANFAVSPDGRRIVYVARENDVTSLWIREINSVNARKLPGTENARIPDWSADGQSVVFATRQDLRRVDVLGGGTQTLASLVGFEYRRSTSNRDGDIIFGNSVLRHIPATGGPAEAITELDTSLGENLSRRAVVPSGWPAFSLSGREH